jgi:hypothetical protein
MIKKNNPPVFYWWGRFAIICWTATITAVTMVIILFIQISVFDIENNILG